MGTEAYYAKQSEMSKLLFEVIELAGKPENQKALPGLKHLLLGDAGVMLADKLNKMDSKQYEVVSPERGYEMACNKKRQERLTQMELQK